MRDRSLPIERYFAKIDRMGLPALSSAGFYFRYHNMYYVLYPCAGMSYKYTPRLLYVVSGGLFRADTSLEEFTKFITLIEVAGHWLKKQDEKLFMKAQERVHRDFKTYGVYKGKEYTVLGLALSYYFKASYREDLKRDWDELKRDNFILTWTPEDDENPPADEAVITMGTLFQWESPEWLKNLEFLVWQTYYSMLYKQRPHQVSPITSASINSGLFWQLPEVRAYMQEIAKPEYMKRFFDYLDSLEDVNDLIMEVVRAGNYEVYEIRM